MTELTRFDIYASNFVYDHLLKCGTTDEGMLARTKEIANTFDAFDNYVRKKYDDVSELNRYDIVNEFMRYVKEEG